MEQHGTRDEAFSDEQLLKMQRQVQVQDEWIQGQAHTSVQVQEHVEG